MLCCELFSTHTKEIPVVGYYNFKFVLWPYYVQLMRIILFCSLYLLTRMFYVNLNIYLIDGTHKNTCRWDKFYIQHLYLIDCLFTQFSIGECYCQISPFFLTDQLQTAFTIYKPKRKNIQTNSMWIRATIQ